MSHSAFYYTITAIHLHMEYKYLIVIYHQCWNVIPTGHWHINFELTPKVNLIFHAKGICLETFCTHVWMALSSRCLWEETASSFAPTPCPLFMIYWPYLWHSCVCTQPFSSFLFTNSGGWTCVSDEQLSACITVGSLHSTVHMHQKICHVFKIKLYLICMCV